MSVINNIYDKIVNYNWIHFNISINNRREVEVDMEKCKKGMQNTAQNQSCIKNFKNYIYCKKALYLLYL